MPRDVEVVTVQVAELRRRLKSLLEVGQPVIVCRNSRLCGVLLPWEGTRYVWTPVGRAARRNLRASLAAVLAKLSR